MIIQYSYQFIKMYRKLPNEIKDLAQTKEDLFKQDKFHPSLRTHKLNGKMSDVYAFSINHKYRILFEIYDEKIIRFISIGGHDMYK